MERLSVMRFSKPMGRSIVFRFVFCILVSLILANNGYLNAQDLPPSMFGATDDYPAPAFPTSSGEQDGEDSTNDASSMDAVPSGLATNSRGGKKFALTSSIRTIGTKYFNIPFLNDDRFLLDSRLRLESMTKFDDNLSLQVTGDLNLLGGSLVRTNLWDQSVSQDDGNYLDLTGGFYYKNSLYFRHSLHRAYLTWETDRMRLDTGRKRLSWGVMRFWRPTDFFNPERPLQIESGERAGIDCIHLSLPFADRKTSAELVYAPFDRDSDSTAAKYSFISGTYDIEITGSSINDDTIYGLTFDGYIGDGGFRGEYTFANESGGSKYSTWAIGGDYAFPSDVTVTIEYASNPEGKIIPSSSRGLAGLDITWIADPLTTINLFASFDDEGNSLALMPRYTYSLAQNDELSLGYVYTKGEPTTLYGAAGKSAFLQFTRFF